MIQIFREISSHSVLFDEKSYHSETHITVHGCYDFLITMTGLVSSIGSMVAPLTG